MTPPDTALAQGFRAARPDSSAGRVRVTAKGHVITNRQVQGRWRCLYVGCIAIHQWPHLPHWIE